LLFHGRHLFLWWQAGCFSGAEKADEAEDNDAHAEDNPHQLKTGGIPPTGPNPGDVWTGGVIPLMNFGVGLKVSAGLSAVVLAMALFSRGEETQE